MFPMKTGDDEDPFLIVNLVPERGHVFNTKKWAPVMICFEAIQLSEAWKNQSVLLAAS